MSQFYGEMKYTFLIFHPVHVSCQKQKISSTIQILSLQQVAQLFFILFFVTTCFQIQHVNKSFRAILKSITQHIKLGIFKIENRKN